MAKKSKKRKNENKNKAKGAKVAKTANDIPREKAPLSRYTILPKECEEMILKEIQSFLENRVTDKWLCYEKQKLMKKHPDKSPESIEDLLYFTLRENEKYNAYDLNELISTLRDPKIIERPKVSRYISIGNNVNNYIKEGGSFSCIISGNTTDLNNIFVCGEAMENVPLFLITGLYDVLNHFTEMQERTLSIDKSWFTRKFNCLAIKNVKNNPFNDMVLLIAEKVQSNFPEFHLQWRQCLDLHITHNVKEKENNMCENNQSAEVLDEKQSAEVLGEKQSTVVLDDKLINSIKLLSNHTFKPDTNQIIVDQTRSTMRPKIQRDYHPMICDKIETVFRENKLALQTLLRRKEVTKRIHLLQMEGGDERYTSITDDAERKLYGIILFREEFAGEELVECVLNVSSMASRQEMCKHIAVTQTEILQHVSNGGSFHFVLSGHSYQACKYIDRIIKNPVICDIKLSLIHQLSTALIRYFPIEEHKALIGFKKTENNPFDDLIKFVGEMIGIKKSTSENNQSTIGEQSDKLIHSMKGKEVDWYSY